jgi:putative ABC transport system permease protein
MAESLRIALSGILSNKLRSVLTVLGVVIGVTTVVAMLAVIQGINASVSGAVQDMGSGSFIISKFPMRNISTDEYLKLRRNPDFTDEDARALEKGSEWIKRASISATTVEEVKVGRLEVGNVPVKGLSSSHAEISDVQVAEGRTFTDRENHRQVDVCVIGPTIAQELFPGLDPLERYLTIKGRRFRVIGVMVERGKMFGQDLDSYVLIPYGSYKKMFGQEDLYLIAKAPEPSLVPRAISETIRILRQRRMLRTADDNNFFIVTQEAIMSVYRQTTGAVYAVMVGVAAISLLVGGVGIMNIMLVTVTERTKEIGLRKAIGARRGHLVLQFLSESAGLSSVGGILGLLFGAGLASLVAAASPIPAEVVGWSIPLAYLFAVLVGVGAGMYPALKAARLDPVEALRRE